MAGAAAAAEPGAWCPWDRPRPRVRPGVGPGLGLGPRPCVWFEGVAVVPFGAVSAGAEAGAGAGAVGGGAGEA